MEVTLKSTDKLVTINGVSTRVWEGATAKGVPMHAYIVRVACNRDADAAEFVADLKECAPATPEIAAIPARLAL